MPELLVIEHERDTPAGLLADWAAGRGLTVTTIAVHAGTPLPAAPGGWDAVAVLGSEHAAYDDRLPWLAAELALVKALVAAGVPVLGICFGGQLLARALGARLYRLPRPEIGWMRVASRTPALAAGPWPSWHQDAFELPDGAVELAANEVSRQGFACGPHLGLQFHPEATEPIVAGWLATSAGRPGEEVTRSLSGAAAAPAWRESAANAGILFSAWLDGKLAAPVAAAG